jgi:hypothetical protein
LKLNAQRNLGPYAEFWQDAICVYALPINLLALRVRRTVLQVTEASLGTVSREFMLQWRNQMLSAGHSVKIGLGLVFMMMGALVLSGFDRSVETVLVNVSPQWLTVLTTRF